MKEHSIPIDRTKNLKIISAALLAAILVIASVCILFIYQIGFTTKEETERYLTELSASVVYSVNARLKANLDALESIALTYTEQKGLGRINMENIQKKASVQSFVRIFIMSFDGKAVGSDGHTHDFSQFPEIMKALTGERVVFNSSSLYGENQNGFTYAVPIYENGEITGAMVASNTTEWIRNLLAQQYFDGYGFLHIIESDGTFVIKSDNQYASARGSNFLTALESDARFTQGTSLDDIKQYIASGVAGTIYYSFDTDQIPKIGKIIPLDVPGYYLFLVVTEEAASKQFSLLLNKAIILNAVIALLFIALIIVLLFTYSRSNRKLSALAFVDSVTKGYNRTRFEIEAKKLIQASAPGTYTFVALNIVQFKLINDALGTQKGNEALKYVHDVLARHLYTGELLCRAGSDNFDLLIKTSLQSEIMERLNLISRDIKQFSSSEESPYFMALTAGIYPIDDPDSSVIHIRDRANVARKSSGATTKDSLLSCSFYSDVERQRQRHEKDIENKMNTALANGDFVVYLQPKTDLKTMKIAGAEALVRWVDKDWGIVPPDEFIPFFEKNRFIVQLDLNVFQQVCRCIKGWIDSGIAPVPISVNLSRVHLDNKHFLQNYIEIQQQYNIPSDLLEFELTESVMLSNSEAVTEVINQIHQAGFLCSIDDFGSSYSSLNMLKDMYIDTLKLDKAFLNSRQMENLRGKAIIASIVDMAKKLGMKTVSEGVETQEQLDFLQSVTCDMAQGYVISKPLPIGSFEELVFNRKQA